MKIGVVGRGMVGGNAAFAAVMTGAASEIVLRRRQREIGAGPGGGHPACRPYAHPARVSAGHYEQLEGGGRRPDLLRGSAATGRNPAAVAQAERLNLCRREVAAAPDAVLVAASNPVDLMTDLTAKIAGLPPGRVLGSGTILDSARLRALVGEHVGVAASSVHANLLGEHGDSEVLVWSSTQVGVFPLASFAEQVGRPLTDAVKQQIDEKVRRAADHIIEGKGATYFGVARPALRGSSTPSATTKKRS
jgi:L-lactate dehydrogenase